MSKFGDTSKRSVFVGSLEEQRSRLYALFWIKHKVKSDPMRMKTEDENYEARKRDRMSRANVLCNRFSE